MSRDYFPLPRQRWLVVLSVYLRVVSWTLRGVFCLSGGVVLTGGRLTGVGITVVDGGGIMLDVVSLDSSNTRWRSVSSLDSSASEHSTRPLITTAILSTRHRCNTHLQKINRPKTHLLFLSTFISARQHIAYISLARYTVCYRPSVHGRFALGK